MLIPGQTLNKRVGGVKVSYRDSRVGYPVFCFPGFPVSSLVFLPLFGRIKARLICPDIPYWAGESESKGEATIEAYTKLADKFIKSFKFNAFGILGYSYGGLIAQNLLSKGVQPTHLILISSFYDGNSILKQRIFRRLLRVYRIRKKIIKRPSTKITNRALIVAGMLRLLRKKGYTQVSSSDVFSQLLSQVKHVNVDKLADSAFSVLGENFLPKKFPKTLIICSDHDLKFVAEESKYIANFAKAKSVTIKNANHNSLFFESHKFSKPINKFLTSY